MAQLADNHALLIYRVGPVLCCAPTRPVETLIQPPSLTHPPGSSDSHPGIFRHNNKLVSLIEVRQLFGVEEQDRTQPGRIINCRLKDQHTGFLVDEIIDVIDTPASGWGQISPSLSGGVFNRSLLLNDKIYLYTEFEKLQKIRNDGFLRPWIEQIEEKAPLHKSAITSTAVVNDASVQPKTAKESTTASPGFSSAPLQPGNRPPKEKTDTTDTPASTGSITPEHSQPDGPQRDRSRLEHSKPDRHQPGAHEQTPVQKYSTPKTERHNKNSSENRKTQTTIPATAVQPAAPLSRPQAPPARTSCFTQTKPEPSSLPQRSDPATNTSSATSMPQSENRNKTGTGLFPVAVLLISTGLISALVYLWPDHSESPTRIPVTRTPAITPQPEDPVADNLYIPNQDTPSPILDEIPNAELSEIPDETRISAPHDSRNNESRYHAAIQHQVKEHGVREVTIIITAPASDEVIRTDAASHKEPGQSAGTPGLPTNVREQQHKPVPGQQVDEVVHIVVKGDTLWHIARRYIHNPFRYPELARLNKIRNPDLIYPGDRVRIIRVYRQPTPVSTD